MREHSAKGTFRTEYFTWLPNGINNELKSWEIKACSLYLVDYLWTHIANIIVDFTLCEKYTTFPFQYSVIAITVITAITIITLYHSTEQVGLSLPLPFASATCPKFSVLVLPYLMLLNVIMPSAEWHSVGFCWAVISQSINLLPTCLHTNDVLTINIPINWILIMIVTYWLCLLRLPLQFVYLFSTKLLKTNKS